MKLSQFKFKLPDELVALEPPFRAFENEDGTTDKIYRRDECRLMVIHRKSQTVEMFKKDADGNDTEEFLVFRDLVRELNPELRLWDVLVEPARKIRIGNKLFFDEDGPMVAEVIDNTTSRGRTLRFLYDCPHEEFKRELFALGSAPLPRYIVDQREATPEDQENFQTIYAKNEGAVTAPSSGLHFSREMLKRLEIRGINFAFITVHCSLGNFEGIEVEDLTKHKMNSEQMIINTEACDIVNEAKRTGHHICAVGVSTARATETAVGTDGLLKEYDGWTNKFIFPPYDFGMADCMIANFYHPESTMLMTAAAFGGYDIVMEGYRLALKHEYKFGCYGDAMLILDD